METFSTFLNTWNTYMYVAAIFFLAAGALILLYHEFMILRIKDYKDKYDYVNRHEIQYFWYAVVAFILAAASFANTMATSVIESGGTRWFIVRCFLIAGFIVIAYITSYSLVRVYYSKKLARRLIKFRNKPRVSPAGTAMRKLSEMEEDPHLEASQIEEEKMKLFDYDVWLDEKTGYKKIEKYSVVERAEECSECGFYTLKIKSEEIEKAPSAAEEGYLVEHYECSYCNHREKREVVIARLSTNTA